MRRGVSSPVGWSAEAPDLEEYRSADPRQIVSGALTDIERYALLDFVREDYLSSYEDDRFVESMRYARAYPTELPILRDLLPETNTPVQIIAGARDPAVPPVNAELLDERPPTASSTSPRATSLTASCLATRPRSGRSSRVCQLAPRSVRRPATTARSHCPLADASAAPANDTGQKARAERVRPQVPVPVARAEHQRKDHVHLVEVTGTREFSLVTREPGEPRPGRVRLRAQSFGVCHSDVLAVEGLRADLSQPIIPGHEVVGAIDGGYAE